MKVSEQNCELYIGTAGWSYSDWEGIVYPKRRRSDFRELRYLAEEFGFNTVELNNTFYRPPSPDYCRKWLSDVRGIADFQFTAKLWRRFTHEREQDWSAGEADRFRRSIAPLTEAGKLGVLLVQFPWSFRFRDRNVAWLGRIADEFGEFPLVVEVRSADWLCGEGLEVMNRLGVGWCNIDQPALRGNIPLTSKATGRVGYLRLHGRNSQDWFSDEAGRDERYDYLYSEGELEEIGEAAENVARKVEKLYLITNNHYRGQAAVNAVQLMDMISDTDPPRPLEYSRQMGLWS